MKKLKLNMKYYEQKKRFVILVLIMFLLIVVAIKLLQFAYASYESTAKLNANIDKAIYLLEAEGLSFNIDPDKIVPSNDAYVYKFSVSNFNENKHSDIDIKYSINITTTTNLPLTYEIYRNENYDDENVTNLFQNATIKQDVDGAWYNVLEGEEKYLFPYTEDRTDIYTLVIHFDESHKQNTDAYADNLESIEVEINSNQVTE